MQLFTFLFIIHKKFNQEWLKKERFVEKYGNSTNLDIKLWIKNRNIRAFSFKSVEIHIKKQQKVDKMWINTPISTHSSKDKRAKLLWRTKKTGQKLSKMTVKRQEINEFSTNVCSLLKSYPQWINRMGHFRSKLYTKG